MFRSARVEQKTPRKFLTTTVECVDTIIVQHGSADTVVRAMNVKYRKWRLDPKPFLLFSSFDSYRPYIAL